jgi:hypothetical protein
MPGLKSQRGYIGLTLIAFLIALTLILYPWTPPKSEGGKCIVGEPPGGYVELKGLPAIQNMDDAPRLNQQADLDIGGPDPVKKSDFVLIRKNVPTGYVSTPTGWVVFGGPTKTANAHTVNAGELPEKPGYDAYYPAEWGEMDLPEVGRKYIRGQGLILFANNDPATIKQAGTNTIFMVDVSRKRKFMKTRRRVIKKEICLFAA